MEETGVGRAGISRRAFVSTSAKAVAGAVVGTLAGGPIGCRGTSLAGGRPGPGNEDLLTAYDGLGLAELVRRGEVTPAELLERAIERATTLDPSLNAIVLRHFGRARDRVGSGALPDGPFRGVPFLLKDLGVELAGTRTTHGSRFWKGTEGPVAERSSALVERYERAGLVIFGKTASPEFGSSSSTESLAYGATQNPWRPGYSAGGSSGGSAAAVAAGIVPLAHASDGGGSIRIPASCCGLFGLKPTRGRTPQGLSSFDHNAGLSINHAVTRTVRDSAALLDATRGGHVRDPYLAPPVARPYLEEVARSPGRLRIGVQRTAALPVEVHADALAALAETERLCRSLGHELADVAAPILPEDLWRTFGILRGTSIAMRVQAWEARIGRSAGPEDLEPANWADYQRAQDYSAMDFERERQRVYGRRARDSDGAGGVRRGALADPGDSTAEDRRARSVDAGRGLRPGGDVDGRLHDRVQRLRTAGDERATPRFAVRSSDREHVRRRLRPRGRALPARRAARGGGPMARPLADDRGRARGGG